MWKNQDKVDTKTIKIYIEELGPIRDSVIELKPFMIFSGESGMGKSYTVLLVHYIYRILCNAALSSFFEEIKADYNALIDQHPDDKEGLLCEFSLNQFEEWGNRSAVSYLADMLGVSTMSAKISIKFEGMADHYKFTFKKEVLDVLGGEVDYFESVHLNNDPGLRLPNHSKNWNSIPFVVLFRHHLREMYHITQSDTFLLPPSRGVLISLSDVARSSILASVGMYREFLTDFSNLKARKAEEQFLIDRYSSLSSDMLHGNISMKDNDLYYAQSYGEIPITAAASSVKELTPFALMLQKGVVGDYSILFEEPESHLHPEMQIKVADLLAYISSYGGRMQITSHSDYLLRRINDLIRLDILKNQLSEIDYLAFCEKYHYDPKITLPSSRIGAYFFKHQKEEMVEIVPQEVAKGVPFDTFRAVLDNQLADSSALFDKVEEIE